MQVFDLAIKSLFNRRVATVLTVVSIGLSVALLIGVERVRQGARESFTSTISGTDLIVGAKGGSVQLLLYAVFRMGSATDNVSYRTYDDIRKWDEVEWTIPYSLGDSHRGFRVVGTSEDFYRHYRYRRDGRVQFAEGGVASGLFDVVVGSEVAEKLSYKLGQNLVLSHGVGEVSFQDHKDKPFKIVGILKKTATPIDRSLYVTLEGIEAIHMDWQDGAPPVEGAGLSPESIKKSDIEIGQITAFLVGTKSRLDVLRLQRDINDYEDEAMMAIIPGVSLSELWEGIGYAEDGLRVVSLFVVIVGMLGMLVSIYNSLNERRREMAILRSVGAGPQLIFGLLILEALLLSLAGVVCGVVAVYGIFISVQPLIESHFGLYLPLKMLAFSDWLYLIGILLFALALGFLPAWRAYRNTLQDGLTIRI